MKKLVALGISMVALTVLGACGNGNSSKDSGEKTVVTMSIAGSASENKIRKETAEDFMKENPDIAIEWVDLGDSRYEKTLTLISGGNAPDILYVNEWTTALAEKGALLSLDELIDGDADFSRDEYYENLLAGNEYEGELYAIPQEVSPFVIYYNKKLFDEAGVAYPQNDWTQEQFFEVAEKLTDDSKKQYGFLLENGYNPTLGWLYRQGAELYKDSEMKESGLGSSATLKGLEFLNQLTEKKISPNPAELTASGQGADAMFRNGQTAMISAGMWFIPPFTDEALDFDWDVVQLPKAENQKVTAAILNWGISSSTKNKEAAWKVLKYFIGEEGQKKVAGTGMALPSMKTDEVNDIVRDLDQPENVEAFINSANNADMDGYLHPRSTEIQDRFQQEVEKMLISNQSPEDTQNNIVKSMNEILE